jgi:hypothetical protein
LRQQLIILRRQVKRPAYTKTDRVLLVFLARVARTWKQAHITRSARDVTEVPSGALPPVLEAHVQGHFSSAKGRCGHHHLDQADSERESALGC